MRSATVLLLAANLATAAPPLAPTPPQAPPIPAGWVGTSIGHPKSLSWGVDYATARRESDRTGKPLMTWFTRPGCEPCVRLETETFQDPSVAAELRGYVRVRVNGPDSPALESAADVTAYPTLVVSQPGTGVVTAKVVGHVRAAEFLAQLRPTPVAAAPGVAAMTPFPDQPSTRHTGARLAGPASTWWPGGTGTGPTPTSVPGVGWRGATSLFPGCPPRG